MITCYFLCNWGETSEELLNRFKLITSNNIGVWKNSIKGTSDLNTAECVITLEGFPNNYNYNLIKNKQIICFPREPNGKKNWENLYLKYGYTYNNCIHVFTTPSFISKTYDFLNKLSYCRPEKKLSAVMSNKNLNINYHVRIQFLINLSKKYPNLCDMYGFGWTNELGSSYKGELGSYHRNKTNVKTKYNALIDYDYSICIENCTKKNYFTEKFTDAILCWTIPIYHGCPNIDEYFPEDCYYAIDINNENSLEIVNNIVKNPISEKNIEALKIARELILNKYNLWNYIYEIVK